MRRICFLFLLLILQPLMAMSQLIQDSASTLVVEVVNMGNIQATVSWNAVPGGDNYRVMRKLPNESQFREVATLQATMLEDNINRIICNDSILYYVECSTATHHYLSNVCGTLFNDPYPTTPCELGVVTVNEDQRIKLSWQPSLDEDIVGYFICQGDETWQALDTVWGKESHEYLCGAEFLSTNRYRFRISAFDTCRNMSPLTAPFNNMVLKIQSVDCSQTIRAQWNSYENIPGELDSYFLYASYDGGPFQIVSTVNPGGELSVDFDVPVSVTSVEVKVEAVNRDRDYVAVSNRVSADFSTADSADFIYIRKVSVSDDNKSIGVYFYVDASYPAPEYVLYRSVNGNSFSDCAHFPYRAEDRFEYFDHNVDPQHNSYSYKLGVVDGCGRNEKYSNTANTLNLKIEQEGSSMVLLSWLPYAGWEQSPEYMLLRRLKSEVDWTVLGVIHEQTYRDDLSVLPHLAEPLIYKIVAQEPVGADYGFQDTLQSERVQYSRDGACYFPNAFTPTASTNTEFRAFTSFIDAGDFELNIYDRSGLLVFHTTDIEQGWDGTYNGELLPMGAYVYIAHCRYSNNIEKLIKGTVLLLK